MKKKERNCFGFISINYCAFFLFKEELLKAIASVVSKCRWDSLQNFFLLPVLFKAQLSFAVSGSIVSILFLSYSTELQKPCAGQPTICEVLEVVLKECRKESLVYKMAALRCAGDALHSSQEDHFSDIAEILFPLIKKVQSYILICYCLFVIIDIWRHYCVLRSILTLFNLSSQFPTELPRKRWCITKVTGRGWWQRCEGERAADRSSALCFWDSWKGLAQKLTDSG